MKIAKNRLHSTKAYISFVSQYTVAHKYPCGPLKSDQQMEDQKIFAVQPLCARNYARCLGRCKDSKILPPYHKQLGRETGTSVGTQANVQIIVTQSRIKTISRNSNCGDMHQI